MLTPTLAALTQIIFMAQFIRLDNFMMAAAAGLQTVALALYVMKEKAK